LVVYAASNGSVFVRPSFYSQLSMDEEVDLSSPVAGEVLAYDGSVWVNRADRMPTGGTTGQVLAKTSATDYDTTWQEIPDVYKGRMVSGDYYTGWRPSGQNLTLAEAEECGVIFVPAVSVTLTRIAILVTSAGTAGAVIRLGIRAMNLSTWLPGNVLVDAGTVTGDSTGFKTATISLAVVANTPYFLTATNQGAPATRAQVACINAALPVHGATTAGSLRQTFVKGSVTGALDNVGSLSRSGNAFPNVYVGVI
jgi:hypothetical protein